MTARVACLVALLAIAVSDARAEALTWREALLALSELRAHAPRAGSTAPGAATNAIPDALAAVSPEAMARFDALLPPVEPLLERLDRATMALDDARRARAQNAPTASKEIAFPNPDPIADCASASGSEASAMLDGWAVSAEVLAAAKWGCLDTVGAENVAALCTAISIETESLETEFELESFCLGVQGDATVSALQDTQSNVVDFVNLRADAMVSSRASQSSLDLLQETLDQLLLRLAEMRTALAVDDSATSSGLADILDRAVTLASQLAALSAVLHDVRFRAQLVQDDAEDAQRRLASAQAQAARLGQLGAQLRSRVTELRSALDAAEAMLQETAVARRDRDIAAALGDPRRLMLRYRLPVQRGGELERSREVLIRALGGYRSLGADVTRSQALLATGDAAFNDGRVLDAYDAFARAYRGLLDTTTMPSVVILRDSFE